MSSPRVTVVPYLDIINEGDDFPIPQQNVNKWITTKKAHYDLRVNGVEPPVGIVHPTVVDALREQPGWDINDTADFRTITIEGNDEASRSEAVARTFASLRGMDKFVVLSRWRDELKPAYGPNNEILFNVERAAVPLLGIVSYGVQLSVYSYDVDTKLPRIWISKRSMTTANYPGLLDNTTAGGCRTGEDPFESVVREAKEEASLPDDVVRSSARACGTIGYFHFRDDKAIGETYLLQPEIEFLYEMELPDGVQPETNDHEVEWFQLWDVEMIKDGLTQRLFKPSYTLVIVDFFVRHGVLTPSNEPDYVDIVSRLHRVLEFPMMKCRI
ncbi:thiamine pyrophosphokinase-related protein-like protein [Bombardia bombarda]|uniref:Thiamine pyrophosphokinase-related protein-like protein n=1 Tax=Bombardia bombarda TaxID=252184 RepID=A0AA39X087_9PEZI|nr:thiamine pyrophosphokinase-related protein-like protein [Bombardia bombarda]